MNIVCDTLKIHEKDQQSTQTLMRCSFHSEKCSLKLIDYYHHFYLCDVFSCFLYWFGFSRLMKLNWSRLIQLTFWRSKGAQTSLHMDFCIKLWHQYPGKTAPKSDLSTFFLQFFLYTSNVTQKRHLFIISLIIIQLTYLFSTYIHNAKV